MGFEARYEGQCSECGERIHMGDEIEYASAATERPVLYVHTVCPGDPRVDLRPSEEVCTVCWLVKPCGCEDGV